MHWTLHTTSPLTLFKLDPLPFGPSSSFNKLDQPFLNSEKTDEEPMGKFLWRDICRHMGIKDSLSE